MEIPKRLVGVRVVRNFAATSWSAAGSGGFACSTASRALQAHTTPRQPRPPHAAFTAPPAYAARAPARRGGRRRRCGRPSWRTPAQCKHKAKASTSARRGEDEGEKEEGWRQAQASDGAELVAPHALRRQCPCLAGARRRAAHLEERHPLVLRQRRPLRHRHAAVFRHVGLVADQHCQ